MPTEPKGQKSTTDAAEYSIRAMQIAPGEFEEKHVATRKDETAAALGRKGGIARAAKMAPERRTEIAKKAAESRWKKS